MRRRSLHLLVGLGTVAACYGWVLPKLADAREIWPAIRQISGGGLLLLTLVAVCNLIAPAIVQSIALPGLSLGRAAASDWATTAVANTMPGGSAIAIGIGMAYAMYTSWQLAAGAIARAFVVTGVCDNVVKLATPAIAVIWLSRERSLDAPMIQAAGAGTVLLIVSIVLLTVVLGREEIARRVGAAIDRVHHRDWASRAQQLRRDTLDFLDERGRRLAWWTMAGHANLFFLLLICLRVVGVESGELSAAAVLAALSFGRLATAIPLTPGGLGVMEVSLTVALGLTGTAADDLVLSAVLLFRFLTYLLPIPLGLVCWLSWSQRQLSQPAIDQQVV